MNLLVRALQNGLSGTQSHIDPIELLDKLKMDTLELSQKNRILTLLYHINRWQEFCLDILKYGKSDLSTVKHFLHPSPEDLEIMSYEEQQLTFINNLQTIKSMMSSIDLHKTIPELHNTTNLELIITLLTHNSYHIGQITQLAKDNGILAT
ncbi:MAG: hypothetical protein INQ03_14040 [Candidatus Heimdallarchaeota archaeon]|nr:hypothetical protein [Candidatus Heimdallarchaeota archaeon]